MSDAMYEKCFKDLCKRGLQYCVTEKEKCYLCSDIEQFCGQPKMPWQCDSYCRDLIITELSNNLTRSENLLMAAGTDNKWLILTGVAALAFFILSVALTIWICIMKRKPRPLSPSNSLIKPNDNNNEEEEDDLLDNSTNGDNTSVAIEIPENGPHADPKPTTTDKATSMTSLLAAHQDKGNDVKKSSGKLSAENTGCPGPVDICMKNLPDPMKQMSPKETDRDEHCFS